MRIYIYWKIKGKLQDIKENNSLVILWKKSVDKEEADFYKIKEDMKQIFEKAEII